MLAPCPIESPQILLIEGDRTLLEITAFRLELLGYEVVTRNRPSRRSNGCTTSCRR